VVRKNKNVGPVTQTALDMIVEQAAKAGLSLEDTLRECCARGWAGFKAAWLEREQAQARASPHPSLHERRAATIAELTGKNRKPEGTIIDVTPLATALD
jgi:hypothetical protein